MKPRRSRKAELPPNAMGGGKSHAETAESAENAEFKMTELGSIPVDWEVKRLGDVSSLITKGTTPTSLGCDFEHYGINFIKAESISDNGDFISGKFAHIDEQTDVLLSRSRLKEGDLLFSIAGVLGRVALVTDEILPANTNQALAVIRLATNDAIDKRYLFFALKSEYLKDRVKEENVAAAQANLSLQDVNEFHIAVPPIAEQRRIAGALSDVDELISALGKLIEKKRNIKTGAMQQLLTGKTRLPGFGANSLRSNHSHAEAQRGRGIEFKQTELGPIPVDWEMKRFDKVFSMLRNNTYARESLTDEREGAFNIHYGDILVKYGALVDFEKDEVPCLKFGIEPNKDMLQDGDLIFADTAEDEMVGKAIEVTGVNGYRAVAGLHTVLCRPNASVFAPGYLGYYINSHAYHNQLLPLITGTKVSSVSRAGFASTYVCIPPFAEQKAIAAVLSDMDAEIAALEADRAKYERIKSGMMQELLTGKTRLKGE